MNGFQGDITHESPWERPPEEYGQDLGHLRHHWNSVVAQGSDMSDRSNGYLERTATNRTGQGTMLMPSQRLIQMPPPHSTHYTSFGPIRNGEVINRSHQSSHNVEDQSQYISMRPTTLQTIHNQPPLSDHSNRSVSALGLSQPCFSDQCNQSVSALGLTQSVANMHLTPSRSLSGVSLATTEASGGGSEKQNKRRKKSKKKATGDSKPNFTLKDYDNICCYIEEEENYDRLFGKSTKTNIGERLMTRRAAYELFAGYLNALNPALDISGRHCAQRFSTYKKKYLTARLWVNNTGAGLTETDLGMTMEQKLESMCPFYNRMDNIFGKKANVEALDERDSTKSMAVMSEAEGETDIETSSNSDSGLSAYELQQRSAKRKLGIPSERNVEDIPTSITSVSDTKNCINKNRGVTDPKSQSGRAKGRSKNLKDINDQKDRDMDNFHMKLFENFITMQQGKWTAEESILKEKSEREFNLEKEKFERQLRMDAEQKEKDKVKNEREYNLEREKFERQLRIDAEEKDRREREFELEKERMERQFQLEKERFDREALMKERETRLGIARELILSGKSSDEIAAIMKAL